MLTLSAAEITAWIGMLWWPFFRLTAAFLVMPLFGNPQIPIQVRIGLALLISVVAAPLMPTMPSVDPFSLLAIFYALQQMIIGALLGLVIDILFAVFTTLGQLLSMQMGLGMAMMNDPVNGISSAVLGVMYQMYISLLFFALNGHLVVLDILVRSFSAIPVGSMLSDIALQQIIDMFGWMIGAALLLALPAIAAMLLVNLTFGIMTRAAPQLNIYALGFPMTLMCGVLSIGLTLSSVPENFTQFSREVLNLLATIYTPPQAGTP
ncbi:MAG: flagellar biosynthetic protein FliR [Plesiomonas sp.]|uniref:flagellar biosynthetic protein FliR n=1 Tax=Plesiomonas sp. TaxID=2486279 RepID=UPI003F3DEB47